MSRGSSPTIAVGPLKRVLKAILALCLAGATLACLFIMTSLIISLGTGADPADAFHPALGSADGLTDTITWEADAPDLFRSIEPRTRLQLESAWLGAISAAGQAATGAGTGPLDVWFSNGAETRVNATLAGNAGPLPQWTGHSLHVNFYSLDGQVVGLDVASSGTINLGDHGNPGSAERSIGSTYRLVLVLLDGNWRVQLLTRLS